MYQFDKEKKDQRFRLLEQLFLEICLRSNPVKARKRIGEIEEMKKNSCMVSCTEAYIGKGPCAPFTKYQVNHYMGKHWNFLKNPRVK